MPSGDPTVVDGRLCRTSPSSIEQLDRCETNWWLNYVGHIEEKVHPTTAFGQRLGQNTHTELEDLMLKGKPLTDPFAKALKKFVPHVAPGLLVETQTHGLFAADIPVKGRIDWTHGYMPKRPIVSDWKTRKDLSKYKKTEEELRADIQMNSYTRWAIEHYKEAESIDVAHYYVETKHHVKKDAEGRLYIFDPGFEPATDRLLLNFSIDETKRFWSNTVEPLVERMKAVAATPRNLIHTLGHPEDMNARDSACNMFGGCPRKHACPHSPMNKLRARMAAASSAIQAQEQPTMALADLLKQHSAPAAVAAPAGPTDGVVPPDAGSRTNPVKVAEAPKEEPKRTVAETLQMAPHGFCTKGHGPLAAPGACVTCSQANVTTPAPAPAAAPTEHKHDYNAESACACGKKKPGRKSKSSAAAPVDPVEAAGNVKPEVVAKAAETAPVASTGEQRADQFEQAAANVGPATDVSQATVDLVLKSSEGRKALERIQKDRLILCLNVSVDGYSPTDLTKYAYEVASAIAGAAGAKDPRFVDKNNPLAYGAWKGALTEYVRDAPPKGWCVLWTRGDEVAEVVAAALAPIADAVIRG